MLSEPHAPFGRIPVFVLAALSLLAGACQGEVSLFIDLRTDLQAGGEFSAVQLRIDSEEPITIEVSPGQPFEAGVRLVDLTGLQPSGRRRLELTFLDARHYGVMERTVLIEHQSDQVVTVLATRSCLNVECEGGMCLNGACVDPGCLTGLEPACGSLICEPSSCVAMAACGSANCAGQVCLRTGDNSLCEANEYCEPDRGCLPLVESCEGSACLGQPLWTQVWGGDELFYPTSVDVTPAGVWAGAVLEGAIVDESGAADDVTAMSGLLLSAGHDGRGSATRILQADRGAVYGIEADGDSLWVTGWVVGAANFGPVPHMTRSSSQEPFLIQLGPDGDLLHETYFGTSGQNGQMADVSVSGQNVAVSGTYGSILDPGVPLPQATVDDGFGVALDRGGDARFALGFGGGVNTRGSAAAASETSVCFAGRFDGPLTVSDGSFTAPGSGGNTSAFVVCYAPDGAFLWGHELRSTGNESPWDLTFDEDGALYLAGRAGGAVMLDGVPIGSGGFGDADAFAACFEPDGALRWYRDFGSPAYDQALGIAISPNGIVALTGINGGPIEEGFLEAGAFLLFLDASDGSSLRAPLSYRSDVGVTLWKVAYDPTGQAFVVVGTFEQTATLDRTRSQAPVGHPHGVFLQSVSDLLTLR